MKSIDIGAKVSVIYIPNAVDQADHFFEKLRDELDWVKMDNTPRREYYCNIFGKPYAYKTFSGPRTYLPQPWTPELHALREISEKIVGCTQEVLFLNRYDDNRDQLGWHADDSDEMDDARPITIISLGAERKIMFCPKDNKANVTSLLLGHGSVCVMPPGMQDTHMHRIPKSGDSRLGGRISLTFRGYVNV